MRHLEDEPFLLDDEPISPDLVLVCPELREAALARLDARASAAARAERALTGAEEPSLGKVGPESQLVILRMIGASALYAAARFTSLALRATVTVAVVVCVILISQLLGR